MMKDEILGRLAKVGNVANFVSFDQRAKRRLGTVADIAALFAITDRVNVRSFIPGDHQSKEFVYGIASPDEAIGHVSRLAGEGLFTIVNELIDTGDGGVSGVIQGGLVEFAPDDTPRCVERPGVCSLGRPLAGRLLRMIYGVTLPCLPGRTEFSIHPERCGTRREQVIIWEHEEAAEEPAIPAPAWPNRFSRHIGDKAFGLAIASLVGLPVPITRVIARRLAPFSFGDGGCGTWVRTCPKEQQPGLYTTVRGWTDPFALLAKEDGDGTAIASVLVQAGVPAKFSGAAITTSAGDLVIEGKAGFGDDFMLGASLPEALPGDVEAAVRAAGDKLGEALGDCRFEWVFDGEIAWVVQLHSGRSCSDASGTIVPGDAAIWVPLETGDLAKLRASLASVPKGGGVILHGQFGLTSHIADVVRKAGIPARRAA